MPSLRASGWEPFEHKPTENIKNVLEIGGESMGGKGGEFLTTLK